MPLDVKRFLTSRRTVLFLMLFLFFSVLLSLVVPQRFSVPPAELAQWQQAHRAWLPLVEFFGLHRLFTAPWFAALLLIFLLSLAIATHGQFTMARRKTFSMVGAVFSSTAEGGPGDGSVELSLSGQEIKKILTRQGYLRVGQEQGKMRYVKHPWGFWGLFFLHLGMFIAVASSLVVATTEKRGSLRLVEGEIHSPGSPWQFEQRGLLARPFVMSQALRLERVMPEFWPQGGIKNIQSEVVFIAANGQPTRRTIAITPILNYQGLRIHQEYSFGNAFYLVFIDRAGRESGVILDIDNPMEREQASYRNFDFEEIPYQLKAKYFADAEKKTLVSDNPLLVLRLVDPEGIILGELALQKGGSGRLGPYRVHLVGVKRWAGFTFLDSTGVAGVFFAFFIIVLGVGLNYFTIPREFYCEKRDSGFRLVWKGSRCRQQFMEEYQMIVKRLKGRESHE